MNKIFRILTIGLLLITQKNLAQTTRTLDNDILFGKVKQISSITYLPEYRSAPAIKDTSFYDEQGNTLEMHMTPRFGSLYKFTYIFSQDSSGKRMKAITNIDGQKISGKFDSKGNMIEYDFGSKNGNPESKGIYEYNEKNNLVKYRMLRFGKIVDVARSYKYDHNNKLIEEVDYAEHGRFDCDIFYQYANL
jgi:hypothetical protein